MIPNPTIFVDEPFLNDLIEQFGKNVKYDRIPEGSLNLGLSPKISVAQRAHQRDPSRHEKIEELLKCLRKKKTLAETRPSCPIGDPSVPYKCNVKKYVLETCMATKVFIPAKSDPEPHFKGLNIWISTKPIVAQDTLSIPAGMLCLLENFSNDKHRFSISGFTMLIALINGIGEKLDHTVLIDTFSAASINNERWKKSRDERFSSTKQYMMDFIKNPFEILERLGCVTSEKRKIEALYYIRSLGPEEGDLRKTISIFGYPIFIKAV